MVMVNTRMEKMLLRLSELELGGDREMSPAILDPLGTRLARLSLC